jgi:hypothetical protein
MEAYEVSEDTASPHTSWKSYVIDCIHENAVGAHLELSAKLPGDQRCLLAKTVLKVRVNSHNCHMLMQEKLGIRHRDCALCC